MAIRLPRVAGFGRSEIPFDMFDLPRAADEARRSRKLASIYHAGQELAWDGKEILPMLLKQHGGIKLPDDKREALSRIFAIIMSFRLR